MNIRVLRTALRVSCMLVFFLTWIVQAQPLPFASTGKPMDLSLRREVARVIDRGNQWLLNQQQEPGHWSEPTDLQVTCLALIALQRDPEEHHQAVKDPVIRRGYAFLRSHAREDGSIHARQEALRMQTASTLLAMFVRGSEQDLPLMREARGFLLKHPPSGRTSPLPEKTGSADTKNRSSELFVILNVLEALYVSRHLDMPEGSVDGSGGSDDIPSLIASYQLLRPKNSDPKILISKKHLGGFTHFPQWAGAQNPIPSRGQDAGVMAYGRESFAGWLCYLYAGLEPNDPRILSVKKWAKEHTQLKSNPGHGTHGLFAYYHDLVKVLTLSRMQEFSLPPGNPGPWRSAVALELMNLQQPDGSWKGSSDQDPESDPILASCYAILTLEWLYPGL